MGGEINFYIDRLRDNEVFEGVPVVHYEEIQDVGQYLIINCASTNFWNISEFLFEQGIETVYHALELLKVVPEDDKTAEMLDARQMYEHYVNKNNGSIYRLSIIITEKCSLRCKFCTEYMPYISNVTDHFDISVCEKAVLNLLDAVGSLGSLMIQGGELFTHPKWADFVTWCTKESRINKVTVLTNSTIIPLNWEALQNEKVLLALDDYGHVSGKLERIIEEAKKWKINYTIFKHEHWYDVAAYQYIEETEKERKEKFATCQIKGCWNISDGFLYRCTTSYYKMKYMLSKDMYKESDFIDLINSDTDQIRRQIEEISKRKYIESCKYCVGTNNDNMITAGEQV